MNQYRLDKGRFETFTRSDGIEHLLVPRPRCELCFRPMPLAFAQTRRCYDCHNETTYRPGLDRVVASTLYITKPPGFRHNREIWALKKTGEFSSEFAEVLVHVLEEEGVEFGPEAELVPIPQTRSRAGRAGPLALALALSKRLDVPVRYALAFNREVRSQKGLTLVGREKNVANSMSCSESLAGKRVYLVDDILTSGSTMGEGARAVLAAGGISAFGIVAARNATFDHLKDSRVVVADES